MFALILFFFDYINSSAISEERKYQQQQRKIILIDPQMFKDQTILPQAHLTQKIEPNPLTSAYGSVVNEEMKTSKMVLNKQLLTGAVPKEHLNKLQSSLEKQPLISAVPKRRIKKAEATPCLEKQSLSGHTNMKKKQQNKEKDAINIQDIYKKFSDVGSSWLGSYFVGQHLNQNEKDKRIKSTEKGKTLEIGKSDIKAPNKLTPDQPSTLKVNDRLKRKIDDKPTVLENGPVKKLFKKTDQLVKTSAVTSKKSDKVIGESSSLFDQSLEAIVFSPEEKTKSRVSKDKKPRTYTKKSKNVCTTPASTAQDKKANPGYDFNTFPTSIPKSQDKKANPGYDFNTFPTSIPKSQDKKANSGYDFNTFPTSIPKSQDKKANSGFDFNTFPTLIPKSQDSKVKFGVSSDMCFASTPAVQDKKANLVLNPSSYLNDCENYRQKQNDFESVSAINSLILEQYEQYERDSLIQSGSDLSFTHECTNAESNYEVDSKLPLMVALTIDDDFEDFVTQEEHERRTREYLDAMKISETKSKSTTKTVKPPKEKAPRKPRVSKKGKV